MWHSEYDELSNLEAGEEEIIVKDEIIFDAGSPPVEEESPFETYEDPETGEIIIKKKEKKEKPKRKKRKFSAEKIKELTELFDNVVVNDYGDDYHLSEKERREMNEHYEEFLKVKNIKRKYGKIKDYIISARKVLHYVNLLAADQEILPKEKFVKKFLDGEIEVFGVEFPKYTGKDKKRMNWSYLAEYILDEKRNPAEFGKSDSELDYMRDDEIFEFMFSDEEKKLIEDAVDIDYATENMTEYFDEDHPQKDYAQYRKHKDSLVKQIPDVLRGAKDRIIAVNRSLELERSLGLDNLSISDFSILKEEELNVGYKSKSDVPEFTGEYTSSKDVDKYLEKLNYFIGHETKVYYNGRYYTPEEVKEMELKDLLEDAGWNVRAIYKEEMKEKKKKMTRSKKKDKKRIDALKERFIKLSSKKKTDMKLKDKYVKKKKKKKK